MTWPEQPLALAIPLPLKAEESFLRRPSTPCPRPQWPLTPLEGKKTPKSPWAPGAEACLPDLCFIYLFFREAEQLQTAHTQCVGVGFFFSSFMEEEGFEAYGVDPPSWFPSGMF